MAFVFTAQTRDGTISLSLIDEPLAVRGEKIDCGETELTDVGKKKDEAKEFLTDDYWTPRTISWLQQIKDTDMDALRAKMQTLIYIMSQPWWVLVYNSGGATEQNKYWDCKRAAIPLQVDKLMLVLKRRKPQITVEAKPFARGAPVDLPRNYIIDSKMWEDNAQTGTVCDSFEASSTGSPTGTRSIDTDGWQKIQVTAGASGDKYGVRSNADVTVVALESFCGRIEYKTSAALTQCKVNIFFYFGGDKVYLVNGSTTPVTTATEAKLESQAVPATRTTMRLYAEIEATGAAPAGTLYVRKSLYYRGETALKLGKDSATIWHESEVQWGPGQFQIDNVPGDVPATALAQIELADVGTIGYACYILKARHRAKAANCKLVYDVPTGGGVAEADMACHGDKRYAINLASQTSVWFEVDALTEPGKYALFLMTRSTAASCTADTITASLWKASTWSSYIINGRAIPLRVQDIYHMLNLGVFEIPGQSAIEGLTVDKWVVKLSYGGAAAGTWTIDRLLLSPVDATGIWVDTPFDQGSAVGKPVITDSISQVPGVYTSSADEIAYPFNFASDTIGPLVFPHVGTPLLLNPGTTNIIGDVWNTYHTTGPVPTGSYGVRVGLRFVPRYSE